MRCLNRADLSSTAARRRGHRRAFLALALVLAVSLSFWFGTPLEAGGQEAGTASSTRGVKVYQKEKCCDGYTIFDLGLIPPCPLVLMDMNGNKVKRWTRRDRLGYLVKMLPGGSILCFGGNLNGLYSTDLLQLDWNGGLMWSFNNRFDIGGRMSAQAHHDFQREGSPVGYYAPGLEPMVTGGKTLVLAIETRLDKRVSNWPLHDPVIYEVGWDGEPTGFEWHGVDHFDEYGFNSTARWIIKYLGGFVGDYLHMNSISTLGPNRWYDGGDARFNPDNIITSSRSANLVTIIDRQTGHIVYRVGPHYSKDAPEGQKLGQIIGQHHAHMIPMGLPGEGNILLFDNGGAAGYPLELRGYSRVIEFNPVTLEKVWEYKHPEGKMLVPSGDGHLFFSFFISGAQRLPNGNTLITEGAVGRIFEVTAAGEVVWEYITGGLGSGMRFIYRAYRVPPEWVPGNAAGYDEWGSLRQREAS